MHTLGMVLTVGALCFCYVPGFWGYLAIVVATTGIVIGILGISSTKTSPSNIGMDTAAFFYGIAVSSFGLAFQAKQAGDSFSFLILDLSVIHALSLAIASLVIFITVGLLARKRFRPAGIGAAFLLYATTCFFFFNTLMTADSLNFSIL